MKKIKHQIFICFFALSVFLTAQAQISLGQSIQIYTHFTSVEGKPSWLLILRDVNTSQVFPYLYDIRNNDNFWIAISFGHSYRVTVSNLKWGDRTVINNFCHLEDGILSGKSMYLTLTGKLTSDPKTFSCHVLKYSDMPLTIVDPT